MKRTHRKVDPQVIDGIGQKLYTRLCERVVGQDEAVRSVVNAYQERLSGMNPATRTVANFLFLGPTGSGKTHLVEQTAKIIAGPEAEPLTIDCAEYQHSHDVAKLTGAPPGYVGTETIPFFNQKAIDKFITRRCQMSFVLFDEIEKAHDSLFNLLLGILAKGRLHTGDNQEISFERSMIFMTSNLGAAEMEKLMNPMGFTTVDVNALNDKLGKTGAAAALKRFTPEFRNRLDHVITFRPLAQESVRHILQLELRAIQETIFDQRAQKSYIFSVTDNAREQIIREGVSAQFGARHLLRTIRRTLITPLANLVVAGRIGQGDMVLVDWKDGKFEFFHEYEDLTTEEMERAVTAIYVKGLTVPRAKDLTGPAAIAVPAA